MGKGCTYRKVNTKVYNENFGSINWKSKNNQEKNEEIKKDKEIPSNEQT